MRRTRIMKRREAVKKPRFITALIAAAAIIGSVTWVSTTNASYISNDKEVNSFETGTVDIELNENGFQDKTEWTGSSTEKKVQITNKSKSPALIRVAVIPRWVDENGNPWAGDTERVVINYSGSAHWVDGKDGYYYYDEIVETGKDTDAIIDSVSANIPQKLAERYKGKKLIVDVKSESVLAAVVDPSADHKEAVYTKTWTNITNENIKNMLNGLSGI